MADIIAVGKLAKLRSNAFWQRTRCALARTLRDGRQIAPDLPLRVLIIFWLSGGGRDFH